MADVPPQPGWYPDSGDEENLIYFDGERWTWRRRRDPSGTWHQEPIAASPPGPGGGIASPTAAPPSAFRGEGVVGPPANEGPLETPETPEPGEDVGEWQLSPPSREQGAGVPGDTGWSAPSAEPLVPQGRLDLHLSEPRRQARWKTFLRPVLALPNLFVLSVLLWVANLLVVLMWFSALFTARVPRSLWSFVRGVEQWRAHALAYYYFLTDRYPPFSMEDVEYPVTLSLDGPPERFSRLAVLFRLLIAVPAFVLQFIFLLGLGLVAVIAWIVALITGRVPRPIHLALAAGLRYTLRLSAYFYLLTPVYPWGLFGDGPAAPGTLEGGTLDLTGGARGLAIASLVVGGVASIGVIVLYAALISSVSSQVDAVDEWGSFNSQLQSAASQYETQVKTCSSGNVTCVDHATSVFASGMGTAIASLRAIDFPTATSKRDAAQLVPLLERQQRLLAAMATARTATAYEKDAAALAALTKTITPIGRKITQILGQ